MKHLKLFEDYHYSKDDIKNMLLKAQKNSKIELKVDVDELLTGLKDPTKDRFGFEAFVEEEARFISEGDYKRMGEYIEKFKKLGLDTTKIEGLYPKLVRYKEIQFKDLDYGGFDYDTEQERKRIVARLEKELDKLEPFVEELKIEVKRLAKEAKELI